MMPNQKFTVKQRKKKIKYWYFLSVFEPNVCFGYIKHIKQLLSSWVTP